METKSKSYKKTNVAEREFEITHLLGKFGKMSRRQLAQELGVESNSVTAAARNLLDKGQIIESGERWDEETQRFQTILALNKENVKQEKKEKINKSWKISSLELQNQELKSRITLLVEILKFVTSRDAAVSQLVKEFYESKERLQNGQK